MKSSLPVAAVAALLIHAAHADVKMPGIFGDHMVLQRDMPLRIWGDADPGEMVTVSLTGREKNTVADRSGKWMVTMGPLAPSEKPLELRISGKNQIVFQDVLVGDVWLCAGQSNMMWPLGKAENAVEALSTADHPGLRFFKVDGRVALDPAPDCAGKWNICSPDSKPLRAFSATAYFFGREIHSSQKVPIGLIGSYWGGSPVQAWTSANGLRSEPIARNYVAELEKTKADLGDLKLAYQTKTLPDWESDLAAWKARGLKSGKPRKPVVPDQNFRLPTVLFNGMIHPLVRFGIKGVIWYQGEGNAEGPANAGKGREYARLFAALIKDWRTHWDEGSFPFLFVQLPGYNFPGDEWVQVRESQHRVLALPNTGMAVTIDIGEKSNIHPKNKMDVGARLAAVARKIVYGEDIAYSGPTFLKMESANGKAVLSFGHSEGGLTTKPPGGRLGAFEVAGQDGVFTVAQATIVGDAVVVSSARVPDPVAVRYAWSAWPDPPANLYNHAGFPAVPFHTANDP